MPSIPVPVLGFLFVSFRPSRFRSHSCSTGASLLFRFLPSASFPGFPLSLRFLINSFGSGSDYSASCSSFPFLPVSASQGLLQCSSSAFASYVFPVLSCLISHAFLPGSGTWLPVCFLSPFLASLPTAVPRVLPLCFRFRAFPLPFRFLSSPSVLPPATWPSVLPFRFLPASASQWLPQCDLSALASSVFPVLPSLVSHAFFPGSSYSASCSFPFILPGFAPTAVPPVLPFFSAFFRPLLFRAFPSLSASFRPLSARF